jgi:hypothetical protein
MNRFNVNHQPAAAWLRVLALAAMVQVGAGFDGRASAQEKPRTFDEATAAAWKKAGAQVGWIGTKRSVDRQIFQNTTEGLTEV